MSSVIERILRVRDEASPALREVSTAAQRTAGDLDRTGDSAKKVANGLGYGGLAGDIEDLAAGLSGLGPGAVLAAGAIAGFAVEATAAAAAIGLVVEQAGRIDELREATAALYGQPMISEESTRAARDLSQTIGLLGTAVDGIVISLTDALAPALADMATILLGFTLGLGTAIREAEKLASRLTELAGISWRTGQNSVLGAVLDVFGGAGAAGRANVAGAQGAAAVDLARSAMGRTSAPPPAGGRVSAPARAGRVVAADTGEAIDLSDLYAQADAVREVAQSWVSIDLSDVAEGVSELTTAYEMQRRAAEVTAAEVQRAARTTAIAGGIEAGTSALTGGIEGVASVASAAGPYGQAIAAAMRAAEAIRNDPQSVANTVKAVTTLLPDFLAALPEAIGAAVPAIIEGFVLGFPRIVSGVVGLIPRVAAELARSLVNLPSIIAAGLRQWWRDIVAELRSMFRFGGRDRDERTQRERGRGPASMPGRQDRDDARRQRVTMGSLGLGLSTARGV